MYDAKKDHQGKGLRERPYLSVPLFIATSKELQVGKKKNIFSRIHFPTHLIACNTTKNVRKVYIFLLHVYLRV